MLIFARTIDKLFLRKTEQHILLYCCSTQTSRQDEFKVLNLRHVKGQMGPRRLAPKLSPLPPRSKQMSVTQDWGNVWPGPRTFHPATVPLPLRQGYVEKAGVPPDKFANAELIKIPNFLHLTPPIIKKQCEALKKFCTPWPKALDTDQKCEEHFPLQLISSDYCHSSPSIRNPLARIVTLKFKLAALKLNKRAKDKCLRLIGERYNEETDTVTIVTDRCPLKIQNYNYAMYLLTALFHESWNVEAWEQEKTEADMEHYIWENNASKQSIEAIFSKKSEDILNVNVYSEAVTNLMNEGESEYTVSKYAEAVRSLLGIQPKLK